MNNRQPNQPPIKGPQIDIRTLPNVECEKCHGLNFKQIVRLKRLSPILSGQAKEQFVPVEVFVCDSCGHLNKSLNPFANLDYDGDNTTPGPQGGNLEPSPLIKP